MKYTDNALNILTAVSFKGIGRAWVVKNLQGNERPETIISLLNDRSKQDKNIFIEDFESKKLEILNQINQLEDSCDGLTAIGDSDFPKHRGTVKASQHPICLFYKGDISLLNSNKSSITVIGLLTPSDDIKVRENKIVSEIIKQDVTVVSGLALGCDSIAHEQSLEGGKTIAILPGHLNNIMPATNKELALKIVASGGLLVTEYFQEHKSGMELNSRYSDRDRLQALFCDAIILVASYAPDSAQRWNIKDKTLDSGARLAMGYAKDYGIPRAVMYDLTIDKGNPMFDLNRQLIAEQPGITTLTQKSLPKIIDMVKSKTTLNNQSTAFQGNLFD